MPRPRSPSTPPSRRPGPGRPGATQLTDAALELSRLSSALQAEIDRFLAALS